MCYDLNGTEDYSYFVGDLCRMRRAQTFKDQSRTSYLARFSPKSLCLVLPLAKPWPIQDMVWTVNRCGTTVQETEVARVQWMPPSCFQLGIPRMQI